jgi:hypothetical protein
VRHSMSDLDRLQARASSLLGKPQGPCGTGAAALNQAVLSSPPVLRQVVLLQAKCFSRVLCVAGGRSLFSSRMHDFQFRQLCKFFRDKWMLLMSISAMSAEYDVCRGAWAH